MKTSLITRLKILSALFSSLHVKKSVQNIQQPTVIVMQNTMPLFKIIGEKYCTNTEVMEVFLFKNKSILRDYLSKF